jgi:hypothetical protein
VVVVEVPQRKGVMGLDQYAYRVESNPQNTDFGYEPITVDGEQSWTELAYWRKHPNLQGWAEALWRHKLLHNPNHGIADTEDWQAFNCQPLRLTLEDLDDLEKCVNNALLPSTTGFFFGDNGDEYYKAQDLEFIKKARQAIAEGYEVYYDSWW